MRNDLKPMKNASFLGVNDGNTMRNAISQFISHSIISLIYKLLSYHLWEHEKWIWKNRFFVKFGGTSSIVNK